MINLSVKTRRNSSPQGKPRVYFSCHPNDLGSCFEILTEEILKTQNCAIYYDGEEMKKKNPDGTGGHDNGELRELLSGMQLFVVPITTNFLTKDSRARSFEYALAVERHIPILPIAMEPGLDKLFAEIMNRLGPGYGDIQFLDRTLIDSTAIPYKEKLKTRLDAILVGDELAKRVRAAFDAYIFLSYRKKDRKSAQELMRLIHSIPYCRDIAIWYDEFLNPGEAWNDAIAEAMAKSIIVVLSVTPDLTEPGNFIIQHEYPEAVKRGKEILPAELLPTDMEALKRLFPEIPDVIDGTSIEAIEGALRDELQKIGLTENDENPEHNYLIGLAYLGGIDVERDTQKAVELIRGAAEKGLPEAIEKLASMYHDGDGVERDYEEEIVWLRKMVEVRRKIYEERGREFNRIKLISSWWKLGDTLYDLLKLGEAKKVYKDILAFFEQIKDDHLVAYSYEAGVVYDGLGRIAEEKGHLEEARDWYIKALSILEGSQNQRSLCINYENLGDIALRQGQLDEAKDWYLKSLNLRKGQHDLSVIYLKLGTIAKHQKKIEEAEEWFLKNLEISKSLVQENDIFEYKLDLSVSYERMGDIEEVKGNLKIAKDWYKKKLSIDLELVKETNTINARRNLIISYEKLGGIALMENRFNEAEDWIIKCLFLTEKMENEVDIFDLKQIACVCYVRLGDIAKYRRKLDEAEQWYRKGLILSKELTEVAKSAKSYDDLSIFYYKLGKLSYRNEHKTNAVDYLKHAIEILEMLVKASDNPRYSNNLEIMKNYLNTINPDFPKNSCDN